ncbi:MAG: YbgA family protein, partial [Gammaproteobacteria bacterium]
QRHKFILLAHDEEEYRKLGPLIASVKKENLQQTADEYLLRMMTCLKARASRKRHSNVLMHVMGFLKNKITSDDKQELIEILDNYRSGRVPLIVPITLMRHHLRRYPDEYISSQYYMSPYPEELMLRNTI